LSDLENLYRPYKKKAEDPGLDRQRSRLGAAGERALGAQKVSEEQFVEDASRKPSTPRRRFTTPEDAIQGAEDIVAELMADVPHFYDEAKALYREDQAGSKAKKPKTTSKRNTRLMPLSPAR
jgi:transcriptional accessory protein Tex/SPT6